MQGLSQPEMHPRVHITEIGTYSPMASSFDFGKPGVDIAEMDMRSALDRLVDDVSIAGGVEPANDRMAPEQSGFAVSSGDVSLAETELITEESTELLANLRESLRGHGDSTPALPHPMQRSHTAPNPTIPSGSPSPFFPDVGVDLDFGDRSEVYEEEQSLPPPLPPKTPEKTARQIREEMIKEKRRIARGRESGEYFVPPRRDAAGNLIEESPASKRHSAGRPKARRSMSMGEVEEYMEKVRVIY